MSSTRSVEFVNIKARGDVSKTESFKYLTARGSSYQQIYDSICRVSSEAVQESISLAKDDAIIEHIKCAIENGLCTKGEIKKFTTDEYGDPRRPVLRVLERWEGELWHVDVGVNNTHAYRLAAPNFATG